MILRKPNVQVSLEEYGEVKTFMLKSDGDNIPVTNENRTQYVALYLDWVLNTAIYDQFRAFYLGFHSVCASNALIVRQSKTFTAKSIRYCLDSLHNFLNLKLRLLELPINKSYQKLAHAFLLVFLGTEFI